MESHKQQESSRPGTRSKLPRLSAQDRLADRPDLATSTAPASPAIGSLPRGIMTKSYQCWVYIFLLVACQLCAAFGDVGVGVCTSVTDDLDCDIDSSDPTTMRQDDDDDDDDDDDGGGGGSIANIMQGHETIHIDSFIDAAKARAGTLSKSPMEATYSIVNTYFGAFLPEALNPARSTATRQAGRCFEEVDDMLEDLRATSSIPATTVKSSSSAMNAVTDTATTSWFFCTFTNSLVQLDPAVPTSHVNAHDWDIDLFLNGIFFGGESPLCPEAKSDANGGVGREAVDACYYRISDKIIESKNSDNDDDDGGINNSDDNDDHGDGDGIIRQGYLLRPNGAGPSASPGLRQAPAPAMDPSMFGMNEARQAPAPAMAPSMFTSSGKARAPVPSAMDPTLFPFADVDESHSPSPALDPSLSRFDDETRPPQPSAMMDDLSPPPSFEQESFFDAMPQPQRKLRGAAMKDQADSDTLAKAHRAVAADEPFELEAFIVASTRKFEETKARKKRGEEERDGRNYVVRTVLGVVEDVAVYVGDLLVEVLPDCINPTSGLPIRADECFLESEAMPVHPEWKQRVFGTNFSPSDYEHLLDDPYDSDNMRAYDETAGWFFCVAKNRLVQPDPMFVCPDNAITGRSFDLSSPSPSSSQTEHLQDQDQDSYYDVGSPVDAIVASEYALYQAEHMQLALYLPLEFHLPAAVGALLARHIAELGDEHAALELVLERFLVQDEEEKNQAFLPEALDPARSTAIGQTAGRCFDEVDSMLDNLRAASATPAMCPVAKSDANGGGGGLEAVDASYYVISDNENRENGGGGINNTENNDNDDGDGGIITQGLLLHPSGARSSASPPSLRQAPAPAMDPSMLATNEAHSAPAPAPVMTPSLFASSGKARPLLPSAMDPTLSSFADVDESHSPARALDPPLPRFDDETCPPLPSAMDDPSAPPFADVDESHSPAPSLDPSLPPFDDEADHPLPSAMDDPSPPPFYQGSVCETVPQRKLRGAAMKDDEDSDILAMAHRAVAADEPFELEAFIISSTRKFEETKAREKQQEQERDGRNYITGAILGVVEDIAVFVGDLLVEALPDWISPTSGLIITADECFREVDAMPVRSDSKDLDFATDRCPYGFEYLVHGPHDSDNLRVYDGATGWLYCAAKNCFVQQDPTFVCPENAITGRSLGLLSPSTSSSLTEHHLQDQDQGSHYDVDSPVDAIVAAEYALYQAEHMQLALHVPLESHLPAAVGALLARHIGELDDEHAAFEAVLESLARDDEERDRVALERHIATQMQNLLSGGDGKQREEDEEEEEEEKPLPPVCRVTEYYTFVPADATSENECGALPDALLTPPMDECTPPETLHGNDVHVTSRSDCRLYLHEHPFRFTPVSIEENFAFCVYDTAATPGSLYYLPVITPPQLLREPGVVERVIEGLVDFVGGAWTDTREAIEPVFHLLQSKLDKVFELFEQVVSSYADDGSIEPNPKGGDSAPINIFIQSSVARTGSAAFSRMVANFADVVDSHFGEFLPDEVNPARYMAARQAHKCFKEVDVMLGYLSSASPTAIAIAERASIAAGAAPSAGDPSSTVWFFCAHTQSLVQLDPSVRAFRGSDNALRLSSPTLLAEGEGEEGEEDWGIDAILLKSENDGGSGNDGDEDGYDGVDTDLYGTDGSSLTDDNVNDGSLTDGDIVTDDGIVSVGSGLTDGSSVTDDTDNVSSSGTSTAAPATQPPPPTPTTIVTTSRDTVVTIATGTAGQTATITFAADTPTVGTHTTTIVYST